MVLMTLYVCDVMCARRPVHVQNSLLFQNEFVFMLIPQLTDFECILKVTISRIICIHRQN